MAGPDNPQSTPGDRLARIEESLAFTDRAVEQLSSEIAALGKSIREMGKRMALLEERLGKALEAKDESDEE